MELKDTILLLHPVIAVAVVFPLLGIVLNRAVQVYQRRQQSQQGDKSKIPPTVGKEHVQLGRWLASSVVGVTLLALANDIFGKIVDDQIFSQAPFKVVLIGFLFVATIASLVTLFVAQQTLWRGVFATLTGMGLVVLGCQDGVYRKTAQWYSSHYYYGIAAALLMIFSVAILPEIYRDRTNVWRKVHVVLNSIAVLLFLGQSMTGTLSLLEVPLTWQEPYINQLYEQQCNTQACSIQATPTAPKP
jgi:MFS family permease